MRSFVLEREEDVTGISGTGTVAEGIEFSDGSVVLRWVVGDHQSTVMWKSIESVEVIHGHDGRTKVVWTDVSKKPAHSQAKGMWRTRDDRVVHGLGAFDDGEYEIVRYDASSKYFCEYKDRDERFPVSLSEAVELTERGFVGLPGGSAFDRAWTAKAFG